MGANSSSAHPKTSSLAEREVEREPWWKAGWHLRESAEFLHRLFPIENIDDDTDLLPSFPQQDATTSESDGKQTSSSYLVLLPPEIIENILSSLDNRSIKSLRLTCPRLGATAALRIDRVFLSANPLNIQVFRAIADHDMLRHRIVEIIYDDARLWRNGAEADEARYPGDPCYMYSLYHENEELQVEWFENERNGNLYKLTERQRNEDPKRPEHVALARRVHAELPLEESWAFYQMLLRQQEDVIANGADADALRYGLQRFPALRKVTGTPATHGRLFTPLYEPPMIRAFPYGFNYPIPRA
ncbi:hypothetical protein HDV63DRAFT_402331 [Trichoderma sp. SZMC 28014]